MIRRNTLESVRKALSREAAVALIGPRQVGKTTLAQEILKERPSIYLDLESINDREKLSDPVRFCDYHQDKLIILDEIHRVPHLFEELRGIIDKRRREGREHGCFLLLGSAAIELMRQSETLARRIEYVDMGVFNVSEIEEQHDILDLWVRGGFPRSFLATNDEDSFARRRNFIKTYLERDVPMFGGRISPHIIEKLWIMLAHNQGGLLNISQLGRNLGLSTPSTTHYINLLNDLLLIRRLEPYHINVQKRLVKTPKTYIRDSGLVHALLNISNYDDLIGHPVVGGSWEGFVIENILSVAPITTKGYFYRTARGSEIDLILDIGGRHGIWAIEIKKGSIPKTGKGFTVALEDIQPNKAFIVYDGKERYPKGNNIEAIGLGDMVETIKSVNLT